MILTDSRSRHPDVRGDVITYKFSKLNISTRQLSYRKEDRAMRPIYGCHEKFPESSLSPGYFTRNL